MPLPEASEVVRASLEATAIYFCNCSRIDSITVCQRSTIGVPPTKILPACWCHSADGSVYWFVRAVGGENYAVLKLERSISQLIIVVSAQR